jgi:hypothetical protein
MTTAVSGLIKIGQASTASFQERMRLCMMAMAKFLAVWPNTAFPARCWVRIGVALKQID